MWVLIALLGAWCAMATIEHLHWFFIENPVDVAIEASYFRMARENAEILLMLNGVTTLAETIFEATCEHGVEYPDRTRRGVAQALSASRQLIAMRVGPNPFYHDHHPQGRWPFDDQGKVKT